MFYYGAWLAIVKGMAYSITRQACMHGMAMDDASDVIYMSKDTR